jgi:hypothetical protein
MPLYLSLKIVSSLRTSEGLINVDFFIMLTFRNLPSTVTDSLFVRLSCRMPETGVLKIMLDLSLLHGVEPQHPRRSRANMLAIGFNRYVSVLSLQTFSPQPALGYVAAYPDNVDRTSWPYIDPRIGFGMIVLTNVVLMLLTGAFLRLLLGLSWLILFKRAGYGGSATTNPHYSSRRLCADSIPHLQSCAVPQIMTCL